jgi:inositol 1,4,5-triphosphate receptor type 3
VIENQVLGRNHDFIHNAALQFAQMVKFVNVHSIDLGNQLMDLIIESIQGPCVDNQQKLVAAKIIDSCKDLISKFQEKGDYDQFGFCSQDQVKQIQSLVTKTNKLLVSLIEGREVTYVLD